MTKRNACFWSFSLFLAGVAWGGEIQAGRILEFGLRAKVKPGEWQSYNLRKIVPVSQTRALALIADERFAWLGPTPVPPAIRKEVWEATTPYRSEEAVMLAFLARDGRVVSWVPVDSKGAMGGGVRWEDAHLLVIEADACPYAVVPPDRSEFFCYDWQLQLKARYQVPTAVYTGVVPVFTGEGLEVWLFPKAGSEPEGEGARPAYSDVLYQPVTELKVVGYRLQIPSGEVKPLAVAPELLVQKLEALANKGRKEKVSLQPGSVRILPVKTEPTVAPLEVVVTAVAASFYESEVHFTGERLFFLAQLRENDVGKVELLPFRFVQEEGAEVRFDEETGVIWLPAFVEPWQLQAFPTGKDGVAMYFDLFLMSEEQFKVVREHKGPVALDAAIFFLVADKKQARIIEEEEIKAAMRKLSTSTTKIIAFPLPMGKFSSREFVFAARCKERTAELKPPCAVTVDLGF